jgi:hypothetical protein
MMVNTFQKIEEEQTRQQRDTFKKISIKAKVKNTTSFLQLQELARLNLLIQMN